MHQSRHDADSYQRVEVITGRRRRRDWSDEGKAHCPLPPPPFFFNVRNKLLTTAP